MPNAFTQDTSALTLYIVSSAQKLYECDRVVRFQTKNRSNGTTLLAICRYFYDCEALILFLIRADECSRCERESFFAQEN